MKITTILLFLFICINSLLAQEKGVKVNSTIKEVTVYLNGARIKRNATVSLKPGKNELILNKLSTVIDESSIQIAGLKNANVLSINYEIDYLEKKATSEKVKALKSQKEDLIMKKNRIQNKLTGYDKELKIFEYNYRVNSDQTDMSLEKLKQVSTYHRERTNAILDKKYILQKQVNELTQKINNHIHEINKLQGVSKEEQGQIRIKLDTPSAISTTLIVSYNVSKSGWFPEYDLKSNSIKSDLNIVYKANVYQETGVNWKDVDITLSTGDPSLDNNKPNLESKYLNFISGNYRKQEVSSINRSNYKYNPTVRTVSGVITGSGLPLQGVSIKISDTTISAVTDFDGIYKINVPNGKSNLEITYLGFIPETIPVYASTINIDMKEGVEQLDEVVVIEYGTKKRTFGKALARRSPGVKVKEASSGEEKVSYNETVDSKQEGITNTSFKIKKKLTINSNLESTAIEIDKF